MLVDPADRISGLIFLFMIYIKNNNLSLAQASFSISWTSIEAENEVLYFQRPLDSVARVTNFISLEET